MIEQPHCANTLQYNCVAKNEIAANTNTYKMYNRFFIKNGSNKKLLA